MGKNKLKRWAEMETFPHVIQPNVDYHGSDWEFKGRWNEKVFGSNKDQPLVLELGCGRGEYTVQLARRYPEMNFIGVDIKGARIWRGAKTAREEGLTNVAFLRIRIEFINKFFAPGEVSQVWITFPDPQPRDSKENKRLTSPWFLAHYMRMLRPGGLIRLKTDARALYDYSLETVQKLPGRMIEFTADLYGAGGLHPDQAIKTKYESAFLAEGKKICYLCYAVAGPDLNASD